MNFKTRRNLFDWHNNKATSISHKIKIMYIKTTLIWYKSVLEIWNHFWRNACVSKWNFSTHLFHFCLTHWDISNVAEILKMTSSNAFSRWWGGVWMGIADVSNWQWVSIGLGNGSAMNSRQAINRTNTYSFLYGITRPQFFKAYNGYTTFSLCHSNAIHCQRPRSSLLRVMAWCLFAAITWTKACLIVNKTFTNKLYWNFH